MIVDIKRLGEKFRKNADDFILINQNAKREEDRRFGHIDNCEKELILKMLRGDLGKWIFENSVYSFIEDEYCSDISLDVIMYFIKKEKHPKIKSLTYSLIYCIEETYWVDYIIHKIDREWIYINVPWIVKNYFNWINKKKYCIK
jgi:hypothetical protein